MKFKSSKRNSVIINIAYLIIVFGLLHFAGADSLIDKWCFRGQINIVKMLEIIDSFSSVTVGILAGSLPTISMMFSSLASVNVQFSSTFEASAQNYCAGLILGAVAQELFPQISTNSKSNNMLGVTVGFIIGLFFVNYLDYFVTMIENSLTCFNGNGTGSKNQRSTSIDETNTAHEESEALTLVNMQAVSYEALNDEKRQSKHEPKKGPASYGSMTSGSECGSEADQDVPIMMLSAQAVASPLHRQRIRSKISELIEGISSIEHKSKFLHNYLNQTMSYLEAEMYADQIDEEIHRFQYNLDNCRRLIQGSCSNIEGVVPRLWITDRGISNVKRRLTELKQGAQSLYDALHTEALSTEDLVDIHVGMDRMDNHLNQLHKTIEGYSFKWGRRGKKRIIPVPSAGSFIPMTLIVPVVVDCIVDGFLVGSTSAVSPRAGIILGIANMIEMGFLGLAVSLRVRKCTGNSTCARMSALIGPPLVMLAAALIGAVSGSAARAHPVVFIGFISFGIVALLYLVVNELLVEAREAQAGKEYWWTAMVLFVGIYSVMLLDLVI